MWRETLVIPDTALVRTMNPTLIPEEEFTLEGKAEVVNGDKLTIGGETVRLAGIAAPTNEWCGAKRCGDQAREILRRFTRRKDVRCAPVSLDAEQDGPLEAICTARARRKGPYDTTECLLNWRMVNAGWAIARREQGERHPLMKFIMMAERDAITAEAGMWKAGVDLDQIRQDIPRTVHTAPGEEASVEGTAKVRGGAHLQLAIGDELVQLHGVAPAKSKWCKSRKTRHCEAEARAALAEMIKGKDLKCTWLEKTTRFYVNRVPRATCKATQECDGTKCLINWQMVRQGWAVSLSYRIWNTNDRRAHEPHRGREKREARPRWDLGRESAAAEVTTAEKAKLICSPLPWDVHLPGVVVPNGRSEGAGSRSGRSEGHGEAASPTNAPLRSTPASPS